MKCLHSPRLRLHLPGLLPAPHSPLLAASALPCEAAGASATFCRAFLRSPEVVAAQGRKVRHNSRVVHSTRYNSPKSAQILVGLTACSYSLGKYRFTTRRSRIISFRNSKTRIHNPSRTIRGFGSECYLIIISYGLMDIEKRVNGLQVTHTVAKLLGLDEGDLRFGCSSTTF
jgi:hypothetical protein